MDEYDEREGVGPDLYKTEAPALEFAVADLGLIAQVVLGEFAGEFRVAHPEAEEMVGIQVKPQKKGKQIEPFPFPPGAFWSLGAHWFLGL